MMLCKKALVIFVALALLVSLISGCQQAKNETPSGQATENTVNSPASAKSLTDQLAEDVKNPIKITITLPHDNPPAEDSPILAEFEKRTGVKIVLDPIPGDAHQKLGMMLASNNLSDVMIVYGDQILNQYKQSDQILDLKPLLEKNAPTFYKMMSSDLNLNLIEQFTDKNGKLPYITNDVGLLRASDEYLYEDPNNKDREYIWLPWAGTLYSLYPSIDEVFGKKITNLDEWYQAMKAFKTKYPDKFATSTSSENGMQMLRAFAQYYGYKVEIIGDTFFYTKDGKSYQYIARFPEALQSLKFLNKLYKENLMDKEGPVQNTDALIEKLSAGRVFTYLSDFMQIYSSNDALGANKDTSLWMYLPQSMKAPEVTQLYQANTAYLGDKCLMVTKKCSDPDRFFRLLEYLYSDEGLILNGWGIEGEDYIVRPDGKVDLNAEIAAKFQENDKLRKNRGINIFSRIVNLPFHLSDMTTSATYQNADYYVKENSWTSERDNNIKNSKYNWYMDFAGGYWKDVTTINIVPEDNSTESMALAQIRTPLNDLVAKCIVADTDRQIEQLYNDAIKQFELNGLKELEKFVQDTIDSRRR